jgi:hypothetical protein
MPRRLEGLEQERDNHHSFIERGDLATEKTAMGRVGIRELYGRRIGLERRDRRVLKALDGRIALDPSRCGYSSAISACVRFLLGSGAFRTFRCVTGDGLRYPVSLISVSSQRRADTSVHGGQATTTESKGGCPLLRGHHCLGQRAGSSAVLRSLVGAGPGAYRRGGQGPGQEGATGAGKPHGRAIALRIKCTSSLKPMLRDADSQEEIWSDGVAFALAETGVRDLPETCPWHMMQAFDPDWLPPLVS